MTRRPKFMPDAPGFLSDDEALHAVPPDVKALLMKILQRLSETTHGPPDALGAMTQATFCELYNIDRVTLYHMRRKGLGPEVMKVGTKVLITYRAAREWEKAMTVQVQR